ncbi:MAG: site-2 protease family protein, partial [Acidimicrobiales bacterium]
GSILVPFGLVLLGGPGFGWAKPVPVSLNRLRHPRNQAILVSLAGPASNALVAAVAGVALHFILAANPAQQYPVLLTILTHSTTGGGGAIYWVATVIGFIGLVNLFLGAFNLLPIPPLDGAALLERFIPVSALPTYYRIRMGFLVVVLLLVFLDGGLLQSMYFHLSDWYLKLVSPSAFG